MAGIFDSMIGMVQSIFDGNSSPETTTPQPQNDHDVTPELKHEGQAPDSGMINQFGRVEYIEDIVNYVRKEKEVRTLDRIAQELQWQLNMNFLQGNQYIDIDTDTRRLISIDRLGPHMEREVFNHIAPIYETRLAKLGKVAPIFVARPATGDRKDISTAKICTGIIKGNYTKLKMKKKITSATHWMELTGTVFFKETWGPKSGRLLGTIDDQEIHEGDIEQDVVPPYEILPENPNVSDIDSQRSLIHYRAYKVSEIKNKFGVDVKGRNLMSYNLMSSKTLGGYGYFANVTTVKPKEIQDSEEVIEYMELPTTKYPEGRQIVVAGDQLIHYGPLAYKVGDDGKRGYPIRKAVSIEIPGQFWGECVIKRCIPIQRRYNAVKNRKQDFLNRAAIGVTIYEEGSIDEEALDMIEAEGLTPGMFVPKKPNSQDPHFMDSGQMPFEFQQEELSLLSEFERISGVSDMALKSGVPTGAGSGVALAILQEQDDTRISLTAEHLLDSLVEVVQQWLRLYKQFAKTPRLLRITEGNNDTMILDWQASDITTDDIVLENESILTTTLAQRRQMVYDLMNAGVFNNPQTGMLDDQMRSKILEMLQFGNWEQGTNTTDLHISRAQRENNRLRTKSMIPVIRWSDDHLLHIAEHTKETLSADYEDQMMDNPQIDQVMQMHVQQHVMEFMAKQSPQQPMPQPAQPAAI